MKSEPFNNWIPFNNILYIGDEPKTCLSIIEKFNRRLSEIEQTYEMWFTERSMKNSSTGHDRLQYHIHYHFEGGIAIFKFKNEDELPFIIRKECFNACKNLAEGQLLYA